VGLSGWLTEWTGFPYGRLMAESLTELLERMRGAQQAAVDHQAQVSSAVNETLSGGLGGLAAVADALEALKTPAPSPHQTSPGDAPAQPGAFRQTLANLAQAQLDATNLNAHVANAVNAGVIAGTEGIQAVASGLRELAQAPEAQPVTPPAEQRAALDFQQQMLEIIERFRDQPHDTSGDDVRTTSPGDQQPVIHVCPTCQGTGRVYG